METDLHGLIKLITTAETQKIIRFLCSRSAEVCCYEARCIDACQQYRAFSSNYSSISFGSRARDVAGVLAPFQAVAARLPAAACAVAPPYLTGEANS